MKNVAVQFLGHNFRNPVVAASAEPTSSLENVARVIETGVGAIVLKSITDSEGMRRMSYQTRWRVLDENHQVARGRIGRMFTFYGRTGLEVKRLDEWFKGVETIRKLAKANGCIVIGSVAGSTIEGWVSLVKEYEAAGIELVELNFGCPHPSQMRGETTGMVVGQDKDLAGQIVKTVKEASSCKIIVKLTPQVPSVTEMALRIKEAGADAVTLTNRFVGFLVDVFSGKPYIYGAAGVGGPWVKPLTLRWVYETYRSCQELPIMGSNGAYDARDVIEFMMAGATVVQICSAAMINGVRWYKRVVNDLGTWMEKLGYSDIREVIGVAARNAYSYEEMWSLPKERAFVDKDRCTGCGRCVESCFYGALKLENGEVRVGDCWGCGICYCVCPEGAIELR